MIRDRGGGKVIRWASGELYGTLFPVHERVMELKPIESHEYLAFTEVRYKENSPFVMPIDD